MSVPEILTEEHALLRRFVGRLQWSEPLNREECAEERGLLLAFSCALARHEEFEDEVFSVVDGDAAELAADHRRHAALRAELVAALRDADGGRAEVLSPVVESLAVRLRAHFDWEEKIFWPRYRPSSDPAVERGREERARARLELLRLSARKCGVRLTDSCGRGVGSRRRM